jgi:HlyD family secretion protein
MKSFLSLLMMLTIVAGCGDGESPYRVVGELASDRIEITSESNEPITTIAVTEGETLHAGQVLVEQDRRRAAARLAEAEAALRQANARLDELVRGPRKELIDAARASVEGASQELDFRQAELDRTREVHARGLASPDALDRAQAGLDTAQANLKSRLAQLEALLAGTTIEELAQAEQAVQQAAARRDAVEVDLERLTLRSPVDGIADARLFEVGERPNPDARVYVPEAVRVHVKAGTEARVHVDGLGAPLAGRVRWVSSDAAFTPYYALTERDRSRLSYVAKVDISEQRDRLPDGVPVEVEFLIEQ